jgi:bifunctional non-homologous end joining protein LigD
MSSLSSRSRSAPAGFIGPSLPSPADKPPSGSNWIHEIKHDGRLMARRDPVGIRPATAMTGLPGIRCPPPGPVGPDRRRGGVLRRARVGLPAAPAQAERAEGVSLCLRPPWSWTAPTCARSRSRSAKRPWPVRFNEHLEHPDGIAVFQHACQMGLEGIVSKRLGSRYRSGRSPDWLKFKNPLAPAVKREAEEDWAK